MQRIAFVLVCASVVAAHPLRAQISADTSYVGFHAGQWGIAFLPSTSLSEAGVLRFSTPTRAWVLDGSASFDQTILPGSGLFGTDQSTQAINVNALLGPRWYKAMSARLVRFVGLGISAGYANTHASSNPNRFKNWSAGAYGEVGLQYMFVRHFGLGLREILAATRSDASSTQETGTGTTTTQQSINYHVALQPVQLAGTVFF